MILKKSCTISLLALLASVTIYPVPTFANAASRGKFLEEALSWMTFKKDGNLMTNAELKPLFLDAILSKDATSKFYKVFVIQFQQGVLPKLTLTEGQSCDPSYTLKYKDPRNSSVTWHYQKQFVAESYEKRDDLSLTYCDYRQGLVCNQFTSKCECPEGSKMQEIETGSSVKRCLYEESEICSLIDIAHGNDPTHGPLARDLAKIIFNLEKPVSCKAGTTCRFKDGFQDLSRCYKLSDGPWVPDNSRPGIKPFWRVEKGKDCVLGLYANPGSCDLVSRTSPGLVCYNYGPLKSNNLQSSNRTGYCDHEIGSMGNTQFYNVDQQYNLIDLKPQLSVIGFVNARTTPLRGDELIQYYERFKKYHLNEWNNNRGDKCSVSKTDKYIEIWKYFVGLEKQPPPGQDYVPEATKQELEDKLNEVLALATGVSSTTVRYCTYLYWRTKHPTWWSGGSVNGKWEVPHKCVADGNPPDALGHDGTCQEDPGFLLTRPVAERMRDYLQDIANIFLAERNEDNLTPELEQILDQNPDTCTPGGSECLEGYECFQDLREDQGIYAGSSCKLQNPSQVLNTICRSLSDLYCDDECYSNCEYEHVTNMIKRQFENVVNTAKKLERGETCQEDLEAQIRFIMSGVIVDGNFYKILKKVQDEKDGTGKGFCDYTKLLGCSRGKCECWDGTQPRVGNFQRTNYESDYCYKTDGNCLKQAIFF